MTIARVFLNEQQPALPRAAAYLAERYGRGSLLDLQDTIIVVPGARAGRRLREILVARADQHQLEFWPPQIITVGHLPELLYESRQRFAGIMVQNVAWAHALKQMDFNIVRRVIPHVPSPGGARAWRDTDWLEYGTLLCTQYRSLAAESLTFADVAERTAEMQIGGEARRWQALATIQTAYLRQLDKANLWDRQTARVVAVRKREIRTTADIILVGTADMNRILRNMLDQVRTQVTALIHAPPAWHDRFDEYGCLRPEAWQQLQLEVPDKSIVLVDGPDEQAAAVSQLLRNYNGKYRPDEITIGVPDQQLVPYLQRRLANHGLKTHWAGGRPLIQSEPILLLQAVANYLESHSSADVAAIARHPRVTAWLEARHDVPSNWLSRLDRDYEDCLPSSLSRRVIGNASTSTLRYVVTTVNELLRGFGNGELRLPEWGPVIEQFLLELYGDLPLDRDSSADRIIESAVVAIQKTLADSLDIPAEMAPLVTASEAIRYVLAELKSQTAAVYSGETAIELLGWLELPLDDAPALIVTSFHERFIPRSVTADLFLPNSLREGLDIDDNRRRYARDAYALSTLLRAREQIHLIVARRNAEGDPEVPSRLLLAEDNQTIARRCAQFFDDKPRLDPIFVTARSQPRKDTGIKESRFGPPPPAPLTQPITQLSPTDFRNYIACPYRFYLQKVLRLRTIREDVAQMDPRTFGTLLHEVVRQLDDDSMRACSDVDAIRDFLSHQLDSCAANQFGAAPPPVVRIQVEQMRLRLKAFAERQARRAAEGWRILYTEQSVTSGFPADEPLDGEPLQLTGTIDRIDIHADTGEWAIFDYKSGDAGTTPDAAHRKKGEWVELQLPLYRHLARALDAPAEGAFRLGYILLPKDTKQVAFAEAKWTDEDLRQADDKARDVVRRVRNEEFWPPTSPPPKFSEWAAAVCLDNVLD